ncbi:Voltage-dependent T-type calcium channel subunit alpha-1H [Symbiodinium microadriaticum]|uniref:Voltage-dependent T-type calcium channel subunit alpha-1H n=1 Tax=Symbiodinium microadriaticum TaxID=2951 RepID=A0A1Q9E100_SYMMI|nr:Voltage-dependent T-type calcium channel subunit alpha-1H [Symbiodinium microadriaticum]
MSDSQLQLKSRSRDPVAPRAAKNAAMEQMAALEEVLHAQHSELLLRLDKLEAALSRSRRGESRKELRAALSTSSMDHFEIAEAPSEKKPEALAVPVPIAPNIESNAKAKRSFTSRYELAKEQGNRVEEMKQMHMDSEGDGMGNDCLQDRLRPLRRQDQTVWIIVHVAYAILFTIEMVIRITAAGPVVYLCGPGWAWNWLDVFVVLPAWVELALDLSAPSEGGDGGASSNLRIVRVFKVTRLLQVVRSVRLLKFLSALRALVMSVVDTTRQLAWALLLLGLVIYSFGILFADAALDYGIRYDLSEDATLLEYFGGVYLSCQTLFRAILGGLDWEIAANSLAQVGWFWVQLFHSYIAFSGFAVLNVMTGVFVNSAIKTRERDHETLLQNKQRFKELVSKIWSRMDSSGQGQITIIEFEQMFEDEEMKAFFQTIEINAVDAWTLFDSLDVDGDHTISLEEFSERCMQLHGAARSVDLYALVKQIHALGEQQHQMSDALATLIERTSHVEDSFSFATLSREPPDRGLRLGERKLSLKPSEAEPDSVRWASFGGGSRDFAWRCLRAILELTAVILLIMYVLKYPYARYVRLSYPANQIIYLFSDKVAEDLYTEHKQKAYLGFYLVAMILELCFGGGLKMMDLFFTARTTFNQLVAAFQLSTSEGGKEAGRRSYGGEKLSDLAHEVVQTYVMQNALGNQLLELLVF